MKIRKILTLCLSALLFTASGCGVPGGEKTVSSSVSSAAVSSSSSAPQESSSSFEAVSSAQSVSSESASSKPVSSGKSPSGNTASVPKISSKKEPDGNEWVAYDTNKDRYKLHIKRKDGTGDKVIVNDAVLAPCVAGDWVYYIAPLREIDKVKLDGSKGTKVCAVDAMEALNANAAITAEYKDGYILYKLVQLREVGDSRPHTVTYYKLDLSSNKITLVKQG